MADDRDSGEWGCKRSGGERFWEEERCEYAEEDVTEREEHVCAFSAQHLRCKISQLYYLSVITKDIIFKILFLIYNYFCFTF